MPSQKLIQRLQAVVGLSESDCYALTSMPYTVREFRDGEYILREGDRASQCAVVMSGFLFREKTIGGRAQILSLYIAGDMPDVHTLHLPLMDHDLRSAGPSTIGFVPHSFLRGLLTSSPSLTHAIWRETLIDAAIYREWVANLGARDALARVAHMFCEIAARAEVVGLVKNSEFYLPFTQQNIAYACGLSVVHVNRTIQELRRRGLIERERPMVKLLRREELERVAEFTPDYLHLRGEKGHCKGGTGTQLQR
jgi:CRP-like cAMP-binding protein